MKAIVYCDYGLANLNLADIAKPTPTDDQILVKFMQLRSTRLTGTSSKAHPKSCAHWVLGYASQRTRGWALILRERLKRWVKTSPSSKQAMRCSVAETGPLPSMFVRARIARWR